MSAELPLIWVNPGPNDAFQCWSTSADGDHLGPTIFIDVEASSPNPDVQMVDVVSANYHLKALNQLEASERGDAPFSVGENRALWIAICELMQARQP